MSKNFTILLILLCLPAGIISTVTASTVAYWRFDDQSIGDIDFSEGLATEVAAGNPLPDIDAQTGWDSDNYRKAAHDWSGNGNHLTTWEYDWAGFEWTADVPATTVPQTGQGNTLSIQNTGTYPAAMTWSEQSLPSGTDIETMTPAAFTIEASFKATQLGGFHTIVGRDGMWGWSQNTGTEPNPENWAPLYFSIRPDNQVAITFCDVSGYNYNLESAIGLVTTDRWYHIVGVSDGDMLSLYLDDIQAGTGRQLVGQLDLTASSSSDTSLTVGSSSGSDWQAGTFSVGRGFWGGIHTDRFYGYIDEVRISDTALLLSEFLQYPYGEGSGTVEDPYQIWTAQQMNNIGLYPDDWSSHFKLMADIDMSAYTGTQYNIIGNAFTPFTGTFDGNGHIIHNLTLTYTDSEQAEYVGLFGRLSGAEIQNLGLENVYIVCKYYDSEFPNSSIGGLSGGGGVITNCYVTGSVRGDDYVGGLSGGGGVITQCYTTCSVSGENNVGGLAGGNSGTISHSYATGYVDVSNQFVGGLVGVNWGTITDSYAANSIGGFVGIGGLVGENNGLITACYRIEPVNGQWVVGGLVADNHDTLTACYATCPVTGVAAVGGLVATNDGTITACYATGPTNGSEQVGGLASSNDGIISHCYATGSVYADVTGGGLVGSLSAGTITACFWDIETSGLDDGVGNMDPDPDGVEGRTTAEMKTFSTFSSAGWDFTEMWGIANHQTYPYLRPPADINPADFNYSGLVDIIDLAIFSNNWLQD